MSDEKPKAAVASIVEYCQEQAGITVKVKPTATILDAAKAAGVRIPVLCADDKLHPYGSCRICIVEGEKSPRKFTPSCTTPVNDGMSVKTMTPDLFEARKRILELLPHQLHQRVPVILGGCGTGRTS